MNCFLIVCCKYSSTCNLHLGWCGLVDISLLLFGMPGTLKWFPISVISCGDGRISQLQIRIGRFLARMWDQQSVDVSFIWLIRWADQWQKMWDKSCHICGTKHVIGMQFLTVLGQANIICKVCNKSVPRGGSIVNHFKMTYLIQHLKVHHAPKNKKHQSQENKQRWMESTADNQAPKLQQQSKS